MAKAKKTAKKAAVKKSVKKAASKPAKKAVAKKVASKPAKKTAMKKTIAKPVAKVKSAKKSAPAKKVSAQPLEKAAVAKAVTPKATSSKSIQNFLTPLDDRLIVEFSEAEKKTAGGLYIPETSTISGQFKGKVVAAGRGHRDAKGRVRPMDVKTGDTVLFAEYSGSKINLLGSDYQMLRESEILGIVENN